MFQALGHIMNMRSNPNDDFHNIHDDVWDLLQQFYLTFSNEEAFIAYFKYEWESKIGKNQILIVTILSFNKNNI